MSSLFIVSTANRLFRIEKTIKSGSKVSAVSKKGSMIQVVSKPRSPIRSTRDSRDRSRNRSRSPIGGLRSRSGRGSSPFKGGMRMDMEENKPKIQATRKSNIRF